MEITTCRLRDQVQQLKQHSMKNNLIFTFDDTKEDGREVEGENTVSVVRQFLTQVMHVQNANTFYIPVAHRLGGRRGRHRAILAKFPIAVQLDEILKHGNRLRDTRHGVSRQTPPSITERNQFAMETYKDKRSDANNKARLNNGKLFIKGKLQTQFLEPTLPDPEPLGNDDDGTAPVESAKVKDSGSIFQGFAIKAKTLSDVTSGLQKVLTLPDASAASHLIYAYRVKVGQRMHENFQSDDDHGMGLDLLRMLRTRDDQNILRFEHLQKTGKEAIDKL